MRQAEFTRLEQFGLMVLAVATVGGLLEMLMA
jgi:hypothetical protein